MPSRRKSAASCPGKKIIFVQKKIAMARGLLQICLIVSLDTLVSSIDDHPGLNLHKSFNNAFPRSRSPLVSSEILLSDPSPLSTQKRIPRNQVASVLNVQNGLCSWINHLVQRKVEFGFLRGSPQVQNGFGSKE